MPPEKSKVTLTSPLLLLLCRMPWNPPTLPLKQTVEHLLIPEVTSLCLNERNSLVSKYTGQRVESEPY